MLACDHWFIMRVLTTSNGQLASALEIPVIIAPAKRAKAEYSREISSHTCVRGCGSECGHGVHTHGEREATPVCHLCQFIPCAYPVLISGW